MRFDRHYYEKPAVTIRPLVKAYNNTDHKIHVWNEFVDSDLTEVTSDDCAILPRLLPASYLPVIRRTVFEISTFVFKLMSLPPTEVRAIIPSGPVSDFLIETLQVLKNRPDRLVGSMRFDMAVVGVPVASNPPKLLEINEIGFDGLARSSFIQSTLLNLMPELRKRVVALDTAANEVRNMKRLGRDIARIQYDSYNWDEEFQVQTAQKMGAKLHLISPDEFGCDVSDYPLMNQAPVRLRRGQILIGKDLRPDAVQMSYAMSLSDYREAEQLCRRIVSSSTPQYGPFVCGLIASKMILVLLNDPGLRRRFLGSSAKLTKSILPAVPLEGNFESTRRGFNRSVLKYTDGFGGEQVFMGQELLRRLRRIKESERPHWVVQQRTRLNTLQVNGILSRPRRVIADLGVFVQYDWSRGRFRHLDVGGFITRATNHSLKVNVSGGGIQVPVMFLKGE